MFQEQIAAVIEFYDVAAIDPPLDVVLDTQGSAHGCSTAEFLASGAGEIRGWTLGDQVIHISVPMEFDGLCLVSADVTFRHELSHVLLARLRVETSPWFDEGLAHELGRCVQSSGRLTLHPVPLCAIVAREMQNAVSPLILSQWSSDPALASKDESVFRLTAQSMVRFLMEREGRRDWPVRLHALAGVDLAHAPDLAAEFSEWLYSFDLAERVARGLASGDPEVRDAAAQSLLEYQQLRLQLSRQDAWVTAGDSELLSVDQIARGFLLRDSYREVAGKYFAIFRPHALDDVTVQMLVNASAPATDQLIGFAVMTRRGDVVERDVVKRLWRGLGLTDRARWLWLSGVFPELRI
jgi:hypothetical protein